jgi:hypothetical protein
MNLAEEMPQTAAYVAECRALWGEAHVKNMVGRAMRRGERNCFWAVECVKPATPGEAAHYRVVGAPFDAAKDDEKLQGLASEYGQVFMGIMQPPAGWTEPPRDDGQVGQYCRLGDPAPRS